MGGRARADAQGSGALVQKFAQVGFAAFSINYALLYAHFAVGGSAGAYVEASAGSDSGGLSVSQIAEIEGNLVGDAYRQALEYISALYYVDPCRLLIYGSDAGAWGALWYGYIFESVTMKDVVTVQDYEVRSANEGLGFIRNWLNYSRSDPVSRAQLVILDGISFNEDGGFNCCPLRKDHMGVTRRIPGNDLCVATFTEAADDSMETYPEAGPFFHACATGNDCLSSYPAAQTEGIFQSMSFVANARLPVGAVPPSAILISEVGDCLTTEVGVAHLGRELKTNGRAPSSRLVSISGGAHGMTTRAFSTDALAYIQWPDLWSKIASSMNMKEGQMCQAKKHYGQRRLEDDVFV